MCICACVCLCELKYIYIYCIFYLKKQKTARYLKHDNAVRLEFSNDSIRFRAKRHAAADSSNSATSLY